MQKNTPTATPPWEDEGVDAVVLDIRLRAEQAGALGRPPLACCICSAHTVPAESKRTRTGRCPIFGSENGAWMGYFGAFRIRIGAGWPLFRPQECAAVIKIPAPAAATPSEPRIDIAVVGIDPGYEPIVCGVLAAALAALSVDRSPAVVEVATNGIRIERQGRVASHIDGWQNRSVQKQYMGGAYE